MVIEQERIIFGTQVDDWKLIILKNRNHQKNATGKVTAASLGSISKGLNQDFFSWAS